MTLSKRMVYRIVGLVGSLALLGVISVWGLEKAHETTRIARDEYIELRMILDVDERLGAARGLINGKGSAEEIARELRAASDDLTRFDAFQDTQSCDIAGHEEDEGEFARSINADLITLLNSVHDNTSAAELDELRGSLLAAADHAQGQLDELASAMDAAIASAHDASDRTMRTTLQLLVACSIAIVFVTALISTAQFRSVVIPLRRLRDGVRKIASGRLSERLRMDGDHEFSQLAGDFNLMASKLEASYLDLEQRVREKSKELVQSERLASVGILAAGVAHEINNPLNIISGYAELTLKRAGESGPDVSSADTERALEIIRDESFRCKDIIQKLLSLASTGERPRARVAVDEVVADVASMLESLKQFRGRAVDLQWDDAARFDVIGNETELKQVFLNLLINALEAVGPEAGEVSVRGVRENDVVEFTVSDNGCGMTAETLDRVFEPFYSARNGSDRRGVGLGLSITHAIVESHGGSITAASRGPDQGACFVVRLPACRDDG